MRTLILGTLAFSYVSNAEVTWIRRTVGQPHETVVVMADRPKSRLKEKLPVSSVNTSVISPSLVEKDNRPQLQSRFMKEVRVYRSLLVWVFGRDDGAATYCAPHGTVLLRAK